jgi:hypothetical protein
MSETLTDFNPELESQRTKALIDLLAEKGKDPEESPTAEVSQEANATPLVESESTAESAFTALSREYSTLYEDLLAKNYLASEIQAMLADQEAPLRSAQTALLHERLQMLGDDIEEATAFLHTQDKPEADALASFLPQLEQILIINDRVQHSHSGLVAGLFIPLVSPDGSHETSVDRLYAGLRDTFNLTSQGTFYGPELQGKTVGDLKTMGFALPENWDNTVEVDQVLHAGFRPTVYDDDSTSFVEPPLEPDFTTRSSS